MAQERKQKISLQKRKNKRGQAVTILFTFMLGVTIILLGLAFAPGIKNQVANTTASDQLDCDNNSISSFDRVTCIATDLTLPLIVGVILFIGGAVIVAKIT